MFVAVLVCPKVLNSWLFLTLTMRVLKFAFPHFTQRTLYRMSSCLSTVITFGCHWYLGKCKILYFLHLFRKWRDLWFVFVDCQIFLWPQPVPHKECVVFAERYFVYIGLHVKYLLCVSDFNRDRNLSIEFNITPKYEFSRQLEVGVTLFHARSSGDRQTWRG